MLQALLLAFGAGLVAYLSIRHVLTEQRYRRQAREWGCEPAFREPRAWYGIRLIRDYIQAIREERATLFFVEWQEKNATTFVSRFFDADLVNTSEPANIQAILATQFEDFYLGFRLQSWSPMFGKGIFTTDGAEWKHQRSILRPQFAREILQDVETMEGHLNNLMAHFTIASNGWTDIFDFQPLFMRFTMDSSTELLFGQSTNSQSAALGSEYKQGGDTTWKRFNDAYERGLSTVGIRNFLDELYWLYNPNHFKDDVKTVHSFVDGFVQQGLHRATESDKDSLRKYCFLDELIKENQDPVELRDNLMNILVAGRDTTSSTLGWTMYLLAHNRAIFQELRHIVLEKFGSYESPKNLDFASIKSCAYLQHVLNESLRLYPPVPANARTAVKDTTLPVGGGPDKKSPIFVRKGTSVAYFVGAMHRRKDLWGADADEFRPDRWIGRKPRWDYLPFSGGPRICLGQQQALTLAGFTILRLLQRFDDIQPGDDEKRTRHTYTITDSPRSCWVKLHEASRGMTEK